MSVEIETDIQGVLGPEKTKELLEFQDPIIPVHRLHFPGPEHVQNSFADSDRSSAVLANLTRMRNHGRLGGTGYLSILPVDQGIEHSAGVSFGPNANYFDPEDIVRLAMEGGCNAVASTMGVLGAVSRRYAGEIPFIAKINHNDALRVPNIPDQNLFGSVQKAHDMGAVGVGATIYFGSPESKRQISEIAEQFEMAHGLGMFTVLWCYLRNDAFKEVRIEKEGEDARDADLHTAGDLTGQANHLGVTIGADIIKQKLPELTGGYNALSKAGTKIGGYDPKKMDHLLGEHPIDWCRYQVMSCYAGRIGLINSGGPSGENDIQEAVATAVINKRAGGTGLISGRKAFQRPLPDGVAILHAIQDVYLSPDVTIA